jgi:hypothetical protein
LHGQLLRIVGALNSAHIFGTLVPVEEPSTASKATFCTAAEPGKFQGQFSYAKWNCLMTQAAYFKSVSRRGPVNPLPEREPIPPEDYM